MTRHALAMALACLGLALPLLPQLDEPRLALSAPDIVWLEGATFVMGASERDVAYAVHICREARPLNLDSPSPVFDGACSEMRFARELPRRRVWTAAYGMDRHEVTHGRWRACVAAGRCAPARVHDEDPRIAGARMPVAGVTWAEAERFCAYAGGRLPTDAEWERAARGAHPDHRFPWGRLYNDRLANHGRSPRGPDPVDGHTFAAPVGSYPDGASAYGLLDVAGNVWEWTASPPRDDEVGMGADPSVYRLIRGGSWAQPPEALRVTHRAWQPMAAAPGDVGLRCAYDRPALARGGRSAILPPP